GRLVFDRQRVVFAFAPQRQAQVVAGKAHAHVLRRDVRAIVGAGKGTQLVSNPAEVLEFCRVHFPGPTGLTIDPLGSWEGQQARSAGWPLATTGKHPRDTWHLASRDVCGAACIVAGTSCGAGSRRQPGWFWPAGGVLARRPGLLLGGSSSSEIIGVG